tara:strand:+ start:1542 stop:2522 length:981 start_codon:yes stop_codon:yes gene_type:complete
MKAIIIGSNSFYGSHFAKLLLNYKFNVVGISRSKIKKNHFLPFDKNTKNFKFLKMDLNKNLSKIYSFIKKYRPNYIINFSSQSMVSESWKKPQDWFLTNSYSVPSLYGMLNNLKFKFRLVHISTPEIYGSTKGVISEDEKFNPTTPYAISRVNADFFLKSLNKEFKFDFVGTRAANIYGEYQDLYRIIPRTIYSIINNKKLFLHGGGASIRSFIHIDDVCEATYKIMKNKNNSGEFYHISTKNYISIKELVKLICKIYNYNYHNLVTNSKDRIGKDKFYKLDTKKTQKLGWNSKISLYEGIKKTGDWLIKNKNKFTKSELNYLHKK